MTGVGVASPRGGVFRGTVWLGGTTFPIPEGAVVVDADGVVVRAGPAYELDLPADLPVYGGPGAWVGPGVVDADADAGRAVGPELVRAGLAAARDTVGGCAAARGASPATTVAVGSSSIVVRGVPAMGADGGLVCATAAEVVRRAVRLGAPFLTLHVDRADPHLPPGTLRTLVRLAHEAALPVVARSRTAEGFSRALAAGVDDLGPVPWEALGSDLVERVVASGVGCTSGLQEAFRGGAGHAASRTVAALHAAGVQVRYGTGHDLVERPGVDPGELERLAAAGLGRWGAVRAATDLAARAPGIGQAGVSGRIEPGRLARLVVLAGDPVEEPVAWRSVLAAAVGTWVSSRSTTLRTAAAAPARSGPPRGSRAPAAAR